MTSFARIFDNIKLHIYNRYSENPGKLLIFTGTLGWALSSVAQVGAIVFNEKLTSKDRKFLIPQEIADGAVNVGLFLGITTVAQKSVSHAIETGKIMFKEMQPAIDKVLKQKSTTLDEALKTSGGKISNLLTNKADLQNFVKLKGGATLAAALVGSIISCNLLTPIIRNFIGARWQKKLSSKTNSQETKLNIYQRANLYPTQILASKLGKTDYDKKPVKQNLYPTQHSQTTLKI